MTSYARLQEIDEHRFLRGRKGSARAAAVHLSVETPSGEEWLASHDLTPEAAIDDAETTKRTHLAILRLRPTDRTLVLGQLAGIQLEVIGESLGISKSWASRRHAAALAVVKALLSPAEDAPVRRGRGAPFKYGRDTRERVRDLIVEGSTHRAIAALIGLPVSTVGDIAKRMGIRRTAGCDRGGPRIRGVVDLNRKHRALHEGAE